MEMGQEIPLHVAETFIVIAEAHQRGETIEVSDVRKKLDLKSATVSRTMGVLGPWRPTTKQAGLELIEPELDHTDRRRRPMKLTAKGERLVRNLQAI